MVDLSVPVGTILKIDQASQVATQYGLFRMEANTKIVASIDLTIKANQAEFAEGCVIDASGAVGANGSDGAGGPMGANGGSGTNGLPGQNGHNVTIEAGLAKVGGLTIITDGGAGGHGGAGGPGAMARREGQAESSIERRAQAVAAARAHREAMPARSLSSGRASPPTFPSPRAHRPQVISIAAKEVSAGPVAPAAPAAAAGRLSNRRARRVRMA
jgi:hypothetical protein